jgi:uncharacterized integral membrane protein
MRFFSSLFSLFLITVLVVFALHNRAEVELSLWPVDVAISMPLSMMALLFLAFGFVLGIFMMAPSYARGALEKRRLRKENETLGKKMEALRKAEASSAMQHEATVIETLDALPRKSLFSKLNR